MKYNRRCSSPPDGHRFGGTVAGDDGDETRVVCVLQNRERETVCVNHLQAQTASCQ